MLNNQINLLSGLLDLDTAIVMLLQGVPLPMFLINVDGGIRYTNPAFDKVSGYFTYELTGQKPPYIFWPGQPPRFVEALREENVPVEQKLQHKSGADIWVEIRVTPVSNGNQTKYYIVSCIDISRQKSLEQKLLSSERKFNDIFDAIPFPLAISTLPGLRFSNVNRAFLKEGGYTDPSEIIGHSSYDLDFGSAEGRERHVKMMMEATELQETEMNLRDRSGKLHTAILSAQQMMIDGQKVMLSASLDITERKEAELSLKESEAFNASLLHNSANPIMLTDNTGKIEYANPALVKMTGFNLDEIIGSQPPYQWWPPESATSYSRQSPGMARAQADNVERRLLKKNGEQFWVRMSFRRIGHGGQTKHYLSNWVDITESKMAQEALRISERNYHDLIENSPLGIRILNSQGDTLFANRAFLLLCGYSTIEEYSAVPTKKRYTPASYKEYLERRKRRKAGLAVPSEYEVDMICKHGDVRRLSVSRCEVIWNNQKQYEVIYQDITEKSQFDRDLKESEEKYRTLFETMSQGIIYLDEKGEVVSANPAARAIMGMSAVQTRNILANLKKAVIREDGSEFPNSEIPGFLALKSSQKVENVVMGLFHPLDKKYRWVRADAVPQFRKGQRKPCGVYLTLTDITVLKEAQALSFETEALKRVNRMKTDLLANVSHELRTPLASIKGFIETLIEPDVKWDREQQLDFLQSANREADHLTFLIRDLLDMSRLDAGMMPLDKQKVSVSEILEAARNVLAVVSVNHHLKIRLAHNLPEVRVDKIRMAQVIANLVENACKFSPEGAKVILAVKTAGDDIVFTVKDHGIGMSEETLSQIFNRFYQAQMVVTGKTRGTGLGLPISKGIVESHGGQINVKSKLNGGSLFTVSLPINAD